MLFCRSIALRCTILSYNDDALLRDCDARADARGWVLARAEPRRQGRVHHHQLEQHQVTQRVPSGASYEGSQRKRTLRLRHYAKWVPKHNK